MNPYLQLSNVTVSFNGFLALNDLNLDVSKGELRCLIGPNGAGKTTALDLICGKVKQSAGSIVFNDTVLDGLEEHRIARAGIGRKFQVPSVFRELTVSDNLRVAC
ncbi:MAG: ATP-binding cassette domain-containing protein, partial [Rhizobiales bacterium]|nr:ATP-binding cassette domain-containing protein [Hyphomicrobiales bacterium]